MPGKQLKRHKGRVTYDFNDEEYIPHWRQKRAKYVDMREFSGRSYRDLEDIWPRNMRMNPSECYKVMSVMMCAIEVFRERCRQKYGNHIPTRDLMLLFWIQRCEEARENVGFDSWTVGRPLNMGLPKWQVRQSDLTRMQLIESLPAGVHNLRLYRVTADGKMLMREFMEILEQAHRDIKQWVKDQPDKEAKKVARWFEQYCFDWANLPL